MASRCALQPLGACISRLCKAQKTHFPASQGLKMRAPTPGSAHLEAMQGPKRAEARIRGQHEPPTARFRGRKRTSQGNTSFLLRASGGGNAH
eukprot:10455471-Karenia_brevis.AAC.1